MSVQLDITLNDNLSGPARTMGGALDRLEAQLVELKAPLLSIDGGVAGVSGQMNALLRTSTALRTGITGLTGVLRQSSATSIQLQSDTAKLITAQVKLTKSTLDLHREEQLASRDRHYAMMRAIADLKAFRDEASKPIRSPAGSKDGFFDEVSGLLGGGLSGVLGRLHPALAVAQMLGSSLWSIGAGAFHATAGLMKFGLEQSAWRESTIRTLELTLKSRRDAEQFFGVLDRVADITPFDTKDVVNPGMALLGAGLNQRETLNVLLGASDLTSGVEGGSLSEVVRQITQILGKDRLDQQDLDVLANNTGSQISRASLTRALAQSRGISEEAARGIMRGHGLGGREAISLMLDLAEQRSGGTLGTASKRIGQETIEGQVSTLESNFKRLFQTVALEPVTDFLGKVNDLLGLGSPLSDEFSASIRELFSDTLMPFLRQYEGESGAKKLKKDLQDVFETAKSLAGSLGEISGWLVKLGLGAATTGGRTSGWWNRVKERAEVAAFRNDQVAGGDEQFSMPVLSNAWDAFFGSKPAKEDIAGARQRRKDYEEFQSLVGLADAVGADELTEGEKARGRELYQSLGFGRIDDSLSGFRGAEAFGVSGGMAGGGLLDRPTIVSFAEHEPEIALPLSRVSPIIADAMREHGGGGIVINAPIEVHLTMQGGSIESAEAAREEVRAVMPGAIHQAVAQLAQQIGAI
jgi:hypothetical protein